MDSFSRINPYEKKTAASDERLDMGGRTPNNALRARARKCLSGNWTPAVLVVLLFFVIQNACALIPAIGMIVQWLIVGPLTLGMMSFFMSLNRSEPVEVSILLNGFSRFGKGLGIYVVTTLLIALVMFAAAIPGGILIFASFMLESANPTEFPLFIIGIVLAVILSIAAGAFMYLRYALAYFIANDNPEMGILQAIKRSTEMMYGRKRKLMFLFCSFIGWFFLGFLALGIGMLWSTAYLWAAVAAFYDDLLAPGEMESETKDMCPSA